MKHSTAQSNCSQEENENVGQNSSISRSNSFWFPVYEETFQYAPILGDAVWFVMWLIARTTFESDGQGLVLGGMAINDKRPAGELGVSVKTIFRWRKVLLSRLADHIAMTRTAHGYRNNSVRPYFIPPSDAPSVRSYS